MNKWELHCTWLDSVGTEKSGRFIMFTDKVEVGFDTVLDYLKSKNYDAIKVITYSAMGI